MADTELASDLPVLFSALDTALSLHFYASTVVPKVHDLCTKATRLLMKRVDTNTFEWILAYDPDAYQIVHFGSNSLDYGVCLPKGITPLQFGALLTKRKESFRTKVLAAKNRPSPSPVALSSIAISHTNLSQTIITPLHSPRTPTKSNSGRLSLGKNGLSGNSPANRDASPIGSPTKKFGGVSKLDLSNRLPRFTLKKSQSSDGLSLLERIKLKEKKKNLILSEKLTEESRAQYIKSKVPEVYDVLYELTLQSNCMQKTFKTFPLTKLISIIKDSLKSTMTDDEVEDTIVHIASLLPEKVKKVDVGGIHALKVYILDRNLDLSTLTETKSSI
ncbi:DNA replication factor Cdt1 C-terminal domain-containing protein [Metschnikowia aff. pulcherrima]|uniref:DNA replication factor Cdt1 C-terminal domain-containing protein n=1 Tax=Metschnikowia aff. pulcherrima TaxID=2163413 RepID=A0A4V1AE82_9ASCO|nr:DNA replication factor Cdt1 C-terminal domain-containing protein [Metschnikowia aff. pulcherrima]